MGKDSPRNLTELHGKRIQNGQVALQKVNLIV